MSFKTEDESNKDANQNEDNFGLPDLDYKPLDQLDQSKAPEPTEAASGSTDEVAEEETEFTHSENSTNNEREVYIPTEEPTTSKAPIIIGLLIAVVVCVAGFLVWRYVIQPMNEKTKKEELAKKEKALKAKEEQERIAREKEEERKRLEAEAAAKAVPSEGTIEALTAPTKRYYVVVASAVDGDLVMDYAKKLSAKGVSTKIIPPFGKWKFNRISVGDHDSFAAAQSAADALKSDYGNAVWVIRY